jgi:hypothetical protein
MLLTGYYSGRACLIGLKKLQKNSYPALYHVTLKFMFRMALFHHYEVAALAVTRAAVGGIPSRSIEEGVAQTCFPRSVAFAPETSEDPQT